MIQTLFKKKPFNIQPWEAKLEFKPWMENKRMKFEIDISAICLLLNKKKNHVIPWVLNGAQIILGILKGIKI